MREDRMQYRPGTRWRVIIACYHFLDAPCSPEKCLIMQNNFKDAVAFTQQGEPVGNLTLGRGTIDGQTVYVAVIENRIASGALGVGECDKLASLFKVVATTRVPLVMMIDSAGARVSDGLPALGAFRCMMAAALKAGAVGAPMVCVLGTHCFGGASMLAALCDLRYFNVYTKLAMSGPSILAAAAGTSALDDAFRAIAEVTIGATGRLKLDACHRPFDGKVALPTATHARMRHQMLRERLAAAQLFAKGANESVVRKDLTAMYPGGYTIHEVNGVLQGTAQGAAKDGASSEVAVIGSIDRQPMTAARAHALAALVWKMADRSNSTHPPVLCLHVLVDCETHSTSLEDEKVMLSLYLIDLAHALFALQRGGTVIHTIVLGKLGGGIYVALAAPSSEVHLVYGTEIQLLPGKAIAAILGNTANVKPEFADYVHAGVAEHELKIGWVV